MNDAMIFQALAAIAVVLFLLPNITALPEAVRRAAMIGAAAAIGGGILYAIVLSIAHFT